MFQKYALSFTAGGLMLYESIVVAEELVRNEFDLKKTKAEVRDGNLLQARTASTGKRKLNEVARRLVTLTEDQVLLLIDGTSQDQKLLLWLACCRCYKLIEEFAREVLRGKHLQLDISVQAVDVENFFDAKTLWHEELEQVSASTRAKLQSVLLHMLREADLITQEGIIRSPIMSQELMRVIRSDTATDFEYFPMAVPG